MSKQLLDLLSPAFQSLPEKLSAFIQSKNAPDLDKLKEIHQDFLRRFPRKDVSSWALEDYALGTENRDNVSYWLEFGTSLLGSVRGGYSDKFGLYKHHSGVWKFSSEFSNEYEALSRIKEDISNILNLAEENKYEEIDEYKCIFSTIIKGKLLHLYFPEKFFPNYSISHLSYFLRVLEIEVEEEILRSQSWVHLNRTLLTAQKASSLFNRYDPLVIMHFLYDAFNPTRNYWKISPGERAKNWRECEVESKICIYWRQIGDLTTFVTRKELEEAFKMNCDPSGYYYDEEGNILMGRVRHAADMLWKFKKIKKGDVIVANKGKSRIKGVGIVIKDNPYEYIEKGDNSEHRISVDWVDTKERVIPEMPDWRKTIVPMDLATFKLLFDKEIQEQITVDLTFFSLIERLLEKKGQVILFGPPGTGKTYMAKQFANWWLKKNGSVPTSNFLTSITFHPSFTYEDFIEGYKPSASSQGVLQDFKLQDGLFKKVCSLARQVANKKFVFIIDEINRGNIPKIFGELITLIELDKRGEEVRLPSGDEFEVPPNLYVIGTMNTADRSIKLLDMALRRRFSFLEMMPRYDLSELDGPIGDHETLTPKVILQMLNHRIRRIIGRDQQIGHSYFLKDRISGSFELQDFRDVFRYEIIPLIQEYCYEDYSRLKDVIGSEFVDIENNRIIDEVFQNDDEFLDALVMNFGSKSNLLDKEE